MSINAKKTLIIILWISAIAIALHSLSGCVTTGCPATRGYVGYGKR